MAMLPLLGYHVGDYFQHWPDIGEKTSAELLRKIFYVNWFRRGDTDEFLWPGFGENSRVLEWALRRIEGTAEAEETPIGFVSTLDALGLTGLKFDHTKIASTLTVDRAEWVAEPRLIDEWYARTCGDRLPDVLCEELGTLKLRLAPLDLGDIPPRTGSQATPHDEDTRWVRPRF